MCGIFGLVHGADAPIRLEQVATALTTLRHRGPDDEGYLFGSLDGANVCAARGGDTPASLAALPHWRTVDCSDVRIGLGHRRLSILDLSTAGHQPMASPDGKHWVVFNGEIYNFIELRAQLETSGHLFRTACDTEVLLAAYREWGDAMFGRLIGMFSLAIWDIPYRRIVLGRDPFGIKPLYFANDGAHFAFASEVKALLVLPWVARDLEPEALLRYLRFGIADGGDSTLLHAIRQLPAASVATIPLDASPIAVHPRRYWHLAPKAPRHIGMADAARELRSLFASSVALHLRSDVPLGSCFSGGLDSSAIVLTASGQMSGRVQAFSYINDIASLSEEPFVDLVAAHAPIDVHKVRPTSEEMVADLGHFTAAQDFPVGSASVYAQYCVFKRAHAAGMTVMLDGQGSDEIFGGYPTALAAQMTGLLARGNVAGMYRLWRGSVFADKRMKARTLLAAFGRFLPAKHVAPFLGLAGEPVYPRYMTREWFAGRGVTAVPPRRGRGNDALREELAYFVDDLTLPQLLRFEDRNSMAFSIESRVPFCIPSIAEFAMMLPPHLLVGECGGGKAVLRESMRGLVPDAIIDRPKLGFSTPEGQWFAALGVLADDAAHKVRGGLVPFLDAEGVESLFSRGTTGHFDNTAWRVLSVIRWAESLTPIALKLQ